MTSLFTRYAPFVALSVLLALLFPVARHFKKPGEKKSYLVLQAITLVGAVLGAKLSVLFGDLGWPLHPIVDWGAIWTSGRSITGALLLGFLAAETAKPPLGYTLPPNDRFATLLPFSFAIGRVGCLAAGCCLGIPWSGPWSMTFADGIPRHPTQVYELLFQLAVGGFFLVCLRRGWLFGRFFSLYLVVYGTFRFFLEFLRDTPKRYGAYSGYQLICLALIAVGAAFFLRRSYTRPEVWSAYDPAREAAPSA